jgi:hypothetical protein
MQTFLRNSNRHVGGYGNPDLRLHRGFAGAKEHFDAQVLLDPFEEQLHLPALAVIRKNPAADFRRSNRDQIETPNSANKSLTYDVLMCKR